jgi:ectoine hydroxylase-related dioxygenase (phytanoyl-CoA dioxygenase family)
MVSMKNNSTTIMLEPTIQERKLYENNGYFLRSNLFSKNEIEQFRSKARNDLKEDLNSDKVMIKADKDGYKTLLKMWYTADDDFYGFIARDERLVILAKEIIGGDIYIYSHKMTMKDPGEGGAWEWHQDFGYWHNYGLLAPDMLSIYIALDQSNKENGCLQVLTGSHKLGRLNHVRDNHQTIIDNEYLIEAEKRYTAEYVEMEEGDALIFHCNLLHRSDANLSDTYRWGYIASYNLVKNKPFKKVRDYGEYQPLNMVSSGRFMEKSA